MVVEPPVISGNVTDEAINLTCTITPVETNTTLYLFEVVWLHNGAPVDQSDDRIVVWMYCLYM